MFEPLTLTVGAIILAAGTFIGQRTESLKNEYLKASDRRTNKAEFIPDLECTLHAAQ